MSDLIPGAVAQANELQPVHTFVPANQVVAGTPTTGSIELGTALGVEIGVWEMTPGTARDVEIDEVFAVLSGHARVTFLDGSAPPIELSPGSVVRLTAGMKTEWTVTETLRKIYLC